MGFFEKLKRAITKIKGKLIVSAILVLVIIIWAIAPFSVAIKQGFDGIPEELKIDLNIGLEDLPEKTGDGFSWDIFLTQLGVYITRPWTALGLAIAGNYGYGRVFGYVLPYFLGFYGLFVLQHYCWGDPLDEGLRGRAGAGVSGH